MCRCRHRDAPAIPWQHACTVHIDDAWDTFVILCDGAYCCSKGCLWADTQWRHQPWVRWEACRTTAKISVYNQLPPEVFFTVAFQETDALTQLYSLSDYPVVAQGLFHWSRLSGIHTEPLVARYTVVGVPVVIHVLAPQVQVNVPVVAVVKDLWSRSFSLKCWSCTFLAQVDVLAAMVVQVSLGCGGGTVLSQLQIVVKSTHVLYVEHYHV